MEQTVKKLPDGTAYRISGQGKPVIFLHGFGEDGNIWEEQITELSKSWKCIVPDLPGTGISKSAFKHLSDHSLEALAEKLSEIAKQENLTLFTLFGHSMGGYITLAFAEKYSEKLNGFGLIHSSAYPDSDEKIATRKRSIEFIRENGSRKFMEQMIPNLYGDQYKAKYPERISEHIESMSAFEPEALIAYYEMMIKRPDRTKLLKSIQKPVLFIIGTEDKAVNLTDSLSQSHLPEESHVVILESSGHMGMKEESEKTTITLKQFLVHLNEN